MKCLDAKDHEANSFSKYVYRRYIYNKLIDRSQDPTSGIIGYTIKIMAKILKKIAKPLVRDIFGIESKIALIEDELSAWENTNSKKNPLQYFKKSGEGYGLILKKAALLSQKSSHICNQMEKLGKNIGMIITVRDSIQDLDRDRITDSYNPFFYWKKSDITNYYKENSRILRKNILISVQKRNIEKLSKIKSNNKFHLFKGISAFAAAASNPYGFCRSQLETKNLQYATNQLLQFDSIDEPGTKPKSKTACRLGEDCTIDCCASKSEDCCQCGPSKTEEHKSCCRCFDSWQRLLSMSTHHSKEEYILGTIATNGKFKFLSKKV